MKTKLTKERIEEMVDEFIEYLHKRDMDRDVIVYYNNKRRFVNYGGEDEKANRIEEDANPHDYFDYCAWKHIMSVSFEGPLYEALNDGYIEDYKTEEDLNKLFGKYKLYYELGNSWNFSLYPSGYDNDIEYTDYNEPEEEIYIWNGMDRYELPGAIANVLDLWKALVVLYGTCGSCVIGDGIHFKYAGHSYFMSTNYNQSDSVDAVIVATKEALNYIGATDVKYDFGRLD